MSQAVNDDSDKSSAKSFAPPLGFKFGAVAAGVREAGGARRDLALVASEVPAAAAGVFTVNRMRAAPINRAAGLLPAAGIRAIVANSGNANALTGTAGIADDRTMAEAVARNRPEATRRAANKHAQRVALRERNLPVPPFSLHALADGADSAASSVEYPCVLKPIGLSASRGVIRADDPRSFVAAWRRIEHILQDTRAERRPRDEEAARSILVEGFVPGEEIAVEGLLRGGRLEVLAIFDKPDPLDGPFFEETIYVTPSRHPGSLQRDAGRLVQDGAAALGLVEGPIHAELRLGSSGPVILEIAARTIGGLCARTLRFGAGVSLEELVVTHAMGLPLANVQRERRAAGVMMLPIPTAGILRKVDGVETARAVPGIEDVVITIDEGRAVEPLPEGDAYLGFVFARADDPATAEAALRRAHALLRIDIRSPLPTVGR